MPLFSDRQGEPGHAAPEANAPLRFIYLFFFMLDYFFSKYITSNVNLKKKSGIMLFEKYKYNMNKKYIY